MQSRATAVWSVDSRSVIYRLQRMMAITVIKANAPGGHNLLCSILTYVSAEAIKLVGNGSAKWSNLLEVVENVKQMYLAPLPLLGSGKGARKFTITIVNHSLSLLV